MRRAKLTAIAFTAAMAAAGATTVAARAQDAAQPSIDLPDPFGAATSFGQLPAGRAWGGTTAVAVDRDGKSVWVFERCGGESCAASALPPILHSCYRLARLGMEDRLQWVISAASVRSERVASWPPWCDGRAANP